MRHTVVIHRLLSGLISFYPSIMTTHELIDKLESLSLKDVPQEIVIRPVRIDISGDHDVALTAGGGRIEQPELGLYKFRGRYLRPTRVNKWVMVFLFDQQAVDDLAQNKYTFVDIKNFAERYVKFGRSKGVTITPLASIQCVPAQATTEKNVETVSSRDLKDELRRLFTKLNNNHVDHAVMILPDKLPSWIHGYLQYLETCNWSRGNVDNSVTDGNKLMRTSRIRLATLLELGLNPACRSFIPNLWLKYNVKLGGLNICFKQTFDTHNMGFLADGHLIISIELNQQDAQQQSPLVAVAVGMWDLASPQMSFNTQTRVQAKSMTMMAVEDLEQMIVEILTAYKKRKDNQIPSRVIVFRAGDYKCAVDNESTKQEVISIKRALSAAHALKEASNSGDHNGRPLLTYLKEPIRLPRHKKMRNAINRGRPVESVDLVQTDTPVNLPRASKAPQPVVTVHKLYDEANMSDRTVRAMVHYLRFLTPRISAAHPTAIELAVMAAERTNNIVGAWMDENKMGPEDPEFLSTVNRFLATEMGDSTYKDHLYFA